MANLKTIVLGTCVGGALLLAGVAGVGAYSCVFPKELITRAGNEVTHTYGKLSPLFGDSLCYIRLNDSEASDYYQDDKCDGSVDFTESTNGIEGSYKVIKQTWRTKENEPEFKDCDNFFRTVKESLEEWSKEEK